MCNKAFNTYPFTIQVVPAYCETQEMYEKSFDNFFVFDSVSDLFKAEEKNDKVVCDDDFILNIALIDISLKKCVIKWPVIFYQYYNLLLIGFLQVKFLKIFM